MKIEFSVNFGKRRQPANEPDKTSAEPHRTGRRWPKMIASVGVVALLAGGSGAVYLYTHKKQSPVAVTSPFTAKVQASVQFPLYYPTMLPADYSIDAASVTEPRQGVVLFELKSQSGAPISMSEEARPASFDLGGFYKQFTDPKEVGVSDGSIVVGYLRAGQIEAASRANSQTWVMATTSQHVPQDQLITMLRSLKVSY